MFLELFLFAKKMKFLTQDSLYFQVFPWHFYFMRGHSLVDLTEHDNSAADIMVHSMYIPGTVYVLLHSYVPIINGRRSGTREESRNKHQIQPEYGDEQADAGRDCRTHLARPNSQVRTGTGKISSFSLFN